MEGSVSIYGSVSYSTASAVLNEFYRVANARGPMSFYISGNDSVALAFVSSVLGSCRSTFHVDVKRGVELKPGDYFKLSSSGFAIKLFQMVVSSHTSTVPVQSPLFYINIDGAGVEMTPGDFFRVSAMRWLYKMFKVHLKLWIINTCPRHTMHDQCMRS